MKGDLPVPAGCAALSDDAQAECMDVAYEPDAMPSVVVETRIGSDLEVQRAGAQRAFPWSAVGVGFRTVLVIDVQRVYLVLAVHPGDSFTLAFEA